VPAEPDPIEIAARALRHRDRSRADIDARLDRAGIDEEQRGEALAALERIGYVDDERFAGGRAGALAARGFGNAAIRADLEQHAVEGEIVESALGSLAPEAARAAAIVAQRGRTPRTAALLARKGFSEESVETVIGWGSPGGAGREEGGGGDWESPAEGVAGSGGRRV
jgi:SOS response regulatory protein OraA/RecX